jgi:hypothetical protein
MENIRELVNLKELNFINTVINQEALPVIRNIIKWFQSSLKSLKFIHNFLTPYDLELLFFQKEHLLLEDLNNLEELEIV